MIPFWLCNIFFSPSYEVQGAQEKLCVVEGLKKKLAEMPRDNLSQLILAEEEAQVRRWFHEFQKFKDTYHEIKSLRELADSIDRLELELSRFSKRCFHREWKVDATGGQKTIGWLHKSFPKINRADLDKMLDAMHRDFLIAKNNLARKKFCAEIAAIEDVLSEYRCYMDAWKEALGKQPLCAHLARASDDWPQVADTLVNALDIDIENLLVELRGECRELQRKNAQDKEDRTPLSPSESEPSPSLRQRKRPEVPMPARAQHTRNLPRHSTQKFGRCAWMIAVILGVMEICDKKSVFRTMLRGDQNDSVEFAAIAAEQAKLYLPPKSVSRKTDSPEGFLKNAPKQQSAEMPHRPPRQVELAPNETWYPMLKRAFSTVILFQMKDLVIKSCLFTDQPIQTSILHELKDRGVVLHLTREYMRAGGWKDCEIDWIFKHHECAIKLVVRLFSGEDMAEILYERANPSDLARKDAGGTWGKLRELVLEKDSESLTQCILKTTVRANSIEIAGHTYRASDLRLVGFNDTEIDFLQAKTWCVREMHRRGFLPSCYGEIARFFEVK